MTTENNDGPQSPPEGWQAAVANPYYDTFWRRWTLARMAVAKRRCPARPRDIIAIAAALSCR